jgi:hypothetical protein
LTFEKVNGIFAPTIRGTLKTILSCPETRAASDNCLGALWRAPNADM